MMSIIELEDKVKKLRKRGKTEVFDRVFIVTNSEAELEIPDTFKAKAWEYFAEKGKDGKIIESIEDVMKRLMIQKVVRTYNKQTGESALFNWLRASRPGMRAAKITKEMNKVFDHIEEAKKDCDFCYPEIYTSKDTLFDRIKGKHCITGANVAKYDAYNGMVYFRNHNPLEFNIHEVSDYIETGFKWFKKLHKHKKEFKYPFFMWNCLEKAGASQVHGHAQVLIGKTMHYGKVLALAKASKEYNKKYNKSDYFNDLFEAHKLVGLAVSNRELKRSKVRIFTHLTPLKEKETIIITPDAPSENAAAKKAIFKTLRYYIDKLGMTSFNLTISMPPLKHDNDFPPGFPYIIKIVDRGSIFKPTADMGGMELYGSNVIATDPYKIIKVLKKQFKS